MSNSSKSPFEVRLEVLKMAKEMFDQSYTEATNMAWQMVEKSAEYQNKTMAEMQEYLATIKPQMYTPADVVAKANELYQFIVNTSTTPGKKD